MYGNFYNPYLMNPMLSQQNRLANMENQFYGQNGGLYGTPNNAQQPQQNNNFILKGRPVSNYEEANERMIELDGTVFVFPDYAHKKIYTKQISIDGSPIINSYSLDNPSNNLNNNPTIVENNSNQYIDKINFLEQRVNELESQVNCYVKSFTSNDAVKTNAKSYGSNDANDAE